MDKQNSSRWAWALLLIGSPILITAFQNCGQMFEAPLVNFDETTLSSTGALQLAPGCESQIMNQYQSLYQSTYYSFLTTTCRSCHVAGPGIGAFAYPDVLVSGQNFISRFDRINQNAVNAAHAAGFTGPQNQAQISAMAAQWTEPMAAYRACSEQAVAGAGVITTSKANAAILAAAGNPNTWTPVEWNLMTEVMDATIRNRINLTARMEIRVATIGGVRRGYEFRNPSIRLNAGVTGSFRISGIRIYINNAHMTDVTTYSLIDVTVSATTNTNLAPGYALALAVTPNMPVATDVFGIEIGTIRDANGVNLGPVGTTPPTGPPLPTTVTLAQLLSNDADLGVFQQSCVGCHSAASPLGGLNITDATQARNMRDSIVARMNNVANPMPRSGVLEERKRQIVQIWATAGGN